jgi:hypothetical protein
MIVGMAGDSEGMPAPVAKRVPGFKLAGIRETVRAPMRRSCSAAGIALRVEADVRTFCDSVRTESHEQRDEGWLGVARAAIGRKRLFRQLARW